MSYYPPRPAPGGGYYTGGQGGFVPPTAPIAHDQPCRKCGYNLRGLTTDSRCPECGTPVGFSFHGDLLRFSDPGWVETLHRGTRLFIWGIVVIVFGFVAIAVFSANRTEAIAALVSVAIAIILGWVLTLIGWWVMTTPDPSGLGEDQYGTARKIIRVALIVGTVQQILDLTGKFAVLDDALAAGLTVVGTLAGIVGAVGFFAQLNYLKKLALRIPDPKLSSRAHFLMYALGISYGVLIITGVLIAVTVGNTNNPRFAGAGGGAACFLGIVGLAVVVFLIMYLLLVEKIGKRFKEQAKAARSTWAATAFNR